MFQRELPSVPPNDYAINNFVGAHGWDNEHDDMHAIFFARGPGSCLCVCVHFDYLNLQHSNTTIEHDG